MSNSYFTLKAEMQKDLEAFPMQFAFNMKQFEDGMKALGLTKDDTDKIVSIPGGGFKAGAFARDGICAAT